MKRLIILLCVCPSVYLIQCPNQSYFGATETNTPESNSEKFCSIKLPDGNTWYKQNKCCSSTTISQLHKWWNVDQWNSKETRLRSYERRERNIIDYTLKILTNLPDIKIVAENIYENEQADQTCKDASKKVLDLKISGHKIENWEIDTKKCWSWINELQHSQLCASCDPDSSQYFNIKEKKLILTEQTCKQFASECYNAIHWNNNYLFPYLAELNLFSRCSNDGNQLSTRHSYQLPTYVEVNDIKNCGLSNNCTKLCEGSIMFDYISPEAIGDPDYVRGLWWNFADMLNIDIKKSRIEIKENLQKQYLDNRLTGSVTGVTNEKNETKIRNLLRAERNLAAQKTRGKIQSIVQSIFF